MCGLSGIAQLGGALDPAALDAMGASLFHRGPDQGGVYLDPEEPSSASSAGLAVGLATRRLSILDLSPAGAQPMRTPDETVCIAYNGELYNEPELRRELEGRGYRFRSRSDTETVLYAYQEYGPDVFARFNGMFALAIHDRRRQRLVLARDRMGIKPLYYAWDGRRLVFASELRTLVWHGGIDPVPDRDGLDLYLTFGFVPSPYSLVRGVRKLPGGSILTLDAGGTPQLRRFWQPAAGDGGAAGRAGGEPAAAVRETLRGAISRQMRSDVPVGVLLSGGVDSTIVAAVAAAETGRPLDTFSIVFRSARSAIGEEYNADAGYARRVAELLGARHHEVVCDDGGGGAGGEDVPSLLRRLAAGLDEPVWELSFLSIFLMSRLARQHGVKVLLTGDGSDELFAGYPWIAGAWRQQLYERVPFLPALLPAAARLAPAGSTLRQHVLNLRATVGQPDAVRYEHLHAIFDGAERRRLTGGTAGTGKSPVAEIVESLLAGAGRASRPDRIALLDLALWVREHFNQRVDRMTMLNSVEARVPFQDNEVVDLALSLPFGVKAPRGQSKRLLKEAFTGVIPEFVLRRPKRPFAAPMGAWAGGALRGFAADVLAAGHRESSGVIDAAAARLALGAVEPGREDRQTSRLWTLVMLQLWTEGLRAAPPVPSPNGAAAYAVRAV
jgi:asparagine synthase (glutamine-hydrolysing)